jgi:hypothetical protein
MFDKGQALLLWALECQPEMSPEWNEWYNLEHLPALLQVPGFISGNRYEQIESTNIRHVHTRPSSPRYLSFYELYDESVLRSEAYLINRNSSAPGMRPEWTKRMLTYITSIMGGTYRPLTDTWLASQNRTAETLCAIYLDPVELGEKEVDQWYNIQFLPAVKDSGVVKACRLLGTQQTAPKVEGGVQQIKGPLRVVLTAVEEDFTLEAITSLEDVWKEANNIFSNAQVVLYKRLSLSNG